MLVKSRLSFEMLSKIWNLSDVDGDGFLDSDEFCVAMHLCHQGMAGEVIADTLPPLLVPPSKRKPTLTQEAAQTLEDDPFAS